MTNDEAQRTIRRVNKGGEATSPPFLLPAFLCAKIFIEREMSGYETSSLRKGVIAWDLNKARAHL